MTDPRIVNIRDHGEWAEVTNDTERAMHLADFWGDADARLRELVTLLEQHPTAQAGALLAAWRKGEAREDE